MNNYDVAWDATMNVTEKATWDETWAAIGNVLDIIWVATYNATWGAILVAKDNAIMIKTSNMRNKT